MAKLTQVEQGSIHTFLLKLHTDLKMIWHPCVSAASVVWMFQQVFSAQKENRNYWQILNGNVINLFRITFFKGFWLIKCTFTLLRLPTSEYWDMSIDRNCTISVPDKKHKSFGMVNILTENMKKEKEVL